ncbi:neurofilament medium polypeptide-like [Portunus trituberculatus]|uniref:neurofilament medium polypeptide-like n=1 Tax=Portunus trituberculatus TaxID=210409 RepID=UPI001E1CF982|nr:neurofilament medium polypeptide-like [Portunus trituberculatus]
MDFTGGEICAAQEDWDAIVPAPLDSAVMEEDEKRAGCGCLHLLRRLFPRKKKSKRAKSNQSKVNVIFESNEMKKDEEEQTVEGYERVTRAIVHVDAVQDEGEEHTAEVQENEEELKVDSSERIEPEVQGEVPSEGAKDRKEKEGEVKATTEGWTVVRSKRRHRKVQALPAVPERKPAVEEQAPRPPQAKAAPCREGKNGPATQSARPAVPEKKPAAKQQAPRVPKAGTAPRRKRQEGSGTQRAPNSVRCSWEEKAAEAAVPVAPPMRRCIVGPRGATLRQVHQQFAGVRVTVPPPKDTVTATVRVRGPPRQVAAAVAHLKGLLHEAEVIEARVAVAPHQRRHVVGHRGVTVRELKQQFPDVSVTVPPAGDLE